MNSGASVPGRLADLLRLDGANRPHSLAVPTLAPADASWVVAAWHGHDAIGPAPGSSSPIPSQYWVDVLAAQSVAIVAKLRAEGVDVVHDFVPGRWHVFQLHAGALGSADAAVSRVAQFLASEEARRAA